MFDELKKFDGEINANGSEHHEHIEKCEINNLSKYSMSTSEILTHEKIRTFYSNVLKKVTGSLSFAKDKILLEVLNDENLICKLANILEPITVDMKAETLDEIFKSIRKEVEDLVAKSEKINDIDKRFDLLSKADAFFLIIECLTGEGAFPQDLVNAIKDKYGSNYLEIIEHIDKAILSNDVKLIKKEQECTFSIDDELLRNYVLMKKWQDIQHNYYNDVLGKHMSDVEKEYMQKYSGKNECLHFSNEAQRLRRYNILSRKNLLTIDDIANSLFVGMENEILELCGGKALGLAKLYMNGIKIPNTIVIPTSVNSNTVDIKLPFKSDEYAVRSSANVEDGSKHSFAGMFDSYLGVNEDCLLDAINRVKNSVNNERVKVYIQTNESEIPNMAVVIQEFRVPEYSGVWIGKDLTSGHLEFVTGSGDKLVSGKVNPSHEYWSCADNSEESQEALKLQGGHYVGEILLKLQEKMNVVGDFEWCVLDGNLVMLQYRAVTASVDFFGESEERNNNLDNNIITGVAASRGVVTGCTTYIKNIHEFDEDKWNEDDILTAWFTDPDWMKVLVKCKGLVTAMGGFLCHGAIIARELGIPCVVGIGKGGMKKLWKEKNVAFDKEITLDGTNGKITINE